MKRVRGWRMGSIVTDMAIGMNESQMRTLAPVREVVAGTAALERQCAQDDAGRHAWIGAVLRCFGYPPAAARGPRRGAGPPAAPERL